MSENNISYTKASRFLLPIYGYPLYSKNSPLNQYLINCYIDTAKNFYAVFENSDDEILERIINSFIIHPEYIDSNFDDDGKEVVVKMKIPDEYSNDFNLFLEGKYTKFSKKYKDLLGDSYGKISSRHQRDENGKPVTRTYDVIYPTIEKYKDLAKYYNVELESIMSHGEILSPPDLNLEIYKNIKELYAIK